ncbi:unnamed protein product [Rhizophagus irregularis]|nr:unnamed protein product [Rhizophagus irregularis]
MSNTKSTQKRISESTEETLTLTTPIIYPSRKKVKVNEPNSQLETFTTIIQQSIEIDNNLIDIIKQHPVVNLPKLGQNKLQDRFHFSNETLSFIRHKNHHNQITKAFINMAKEESSSKCLYIRGSSGLGKSHSLYYLVSELRIQPDYRVTYINSCEEWWISHQIEPYQYLINELLCTFNKDLLSPLTITDWAELVIYGLTTNIREKLNTADKDQHSIKFNRFNDINTRKDRFKLFINELADFVKHDFYWVWIFDQCDALHKHEVLNEYPFTLVNSLNRILENAGLIIVSETSSNEICQFKSWNKLQLFDGYDDEEFNQWCILHGYDGNEDQLNYVKYWTGANPLELDTWHSTDAGDLKKKTKNANPSELDMWDLMKKAKYYFGKRECDITRDYKIYQENLSKTKKKNLNQCVVSMILQTDPPTKRDGMNRKFMHVGNITFQDVNEEDEKTKKTIIANYPFIRLVMIHVHGKEIIDDLGKVTSTILQSNIFINKKKERIASLYITTILDIVRKFEFRCWEFGFPSSNVFDKSIVFDKIFRLVNNDVPSSMYNFAVYKNVLFIPEFLNYPGVDFLIWNSEDKVLLAFQIAINKLNDRKNESNFTKENNGPSLKSKWANLFRINESNIYFIWITRDNTINKVTKSSSNQLHVSFSSIKNQFPALANL